MTRDNRNVFIHGFVVVTLGLTFSAACAGTLDPVENIDKAECALNSEATCPCDGTIETCDDGSACINSTVSTAGACLGDCGDVCTAYCQMEIECIPYCLSSGDMVPCASTASVQDCTDTCTQWVQAYQDQSEACSDSLLSWIQCVSTASCTDVLEFFSAHPDGVDDDTPCAQEYRALDCSDFEPRTEYSQPPNTDDPPTPVDESDAGLPTSTDASPNPVDESDAGLPTDGASE